MNAITRLCIVLFLLVTPLLKAQDDPLRMAAVYLQNGQLDSAKIVLDQLSGDPSATNNASVWYLRGFVYKTIYNKHEKSNMQSLSRLEALRSFRHSLSMDTSQAGIDENKKNIKYLTTTLYNDASISLDSSDYKLGIETFEQFKQYYILIDTSQNAIKQYDVKFLLALGSVYSKIFEGDKKLKAEILEASKNKKNEFLGLAKDAYTKVLILDPNNITANYNMGILYYTQAINLINQLDYGVDIRTLNDTQDNSITLFKESLPFMEKSYKLDPNREETLYGLSGIYFSLNEIEKSNEYKKKLEDIKKKQ